MNTFKLIFVFWLICVVQPAIAEQICNTQSIAESTPLSRFKLDSSTAIDLQTGLMWKRCFEGKEGEACTQGELKTMTWPAALQYVENLNKNKGFAGFADWRLPNIRELLSIGEVACESPALNLKVFPAAPSSRSWSSSAYKLYPHYSWYISFSNLYSDNHERFKPYPIILVRDAG